ncbi:Oidioi.mRNA.OKI2018_I69.XSR.g13913.t2.cds [Oikopleura dioica]|uniref:Oidioi.mRNA.OKI2018_I69.XSR.g13913.t2.cds n=1 Tax=Oikopleura dioica TaxID=34765 RepID=A0ABN7SA12_OIKDI|nr:Oidioi.mRNA.OKI2018_I69.XSR.g13913.t2.cds [Oikopleura dioica]
MGNCCSTENNVIQPDNHSLASSTSYYDEQEAPIKIFADESQRRPSNASQITHFSDDILKKPAVKLPETVDIVEEDGDSADGDSAFEEEPSELRDAQPSVGPMPADRRHSTATQEAIFIYQSASRAADRIHQENFRMKSLENVPRKPKSRKSWIALPTSHKIPSAEVLEESSKHQDLHHKDLHIVENIIEEEDYYRKTMNRGRPSISIQPQPESAFLAELRRKQNEPQVRIAEENSRESSRSGASYNSKGSFIPVSPLHEVD